MPEVSDIKRAKTKWAWALATFFGVGFLKPGPGTWGSVAALLLWLAAAHLPGMQGANLAWPTAAAALAATLIGIPAASLVERESASAGSGTDQKTGDPGHIVLDEVAGQWIALIAIPATFSHALAALLFFRVLDITKPPPARQFDRMHGGFGIMMDDVAAGLYALALGHILLRWF